MFLRDLSLHNFKCHAHLELSFAQGLKENRKWTLVLGENGTGKSNVLKAIALITAGSNALGELLGNIDSWIRVGTDACQISATLMTKEGELRPLSLVLQRGDNLGSVFGRNQGSLGFIDSALKNSERNYFVVGYGASRRLADNAFAQETSNRRFNPRAASVFNLFDTGSSLNPLSSWAMDLDYREGEKGLEIVRETLNDFLPGTRFEGIDKERRQLIFKTADGLIPLEQLSDGYQNMAAWIGDLLYRITQTFRDYEKPLSARGLLLIDEIDLHLHPKWQRNLLHFIEKKLPHFQVVASTHSPLTAQQADEGELYALRRNKADAIEMVPFVGSPKKLLIHQLLMTPVFGLETDESVTVENTKAEYQQLKDKKVLTAGEKKRFQEIKKELKEILPDRPTVAMSTKERRLMKKLEKALTEQIRK